MGKTVSAPLNGSDIKPSYPQNASASVQRGACPSDDLVPLQFKMPREFVTRFKQEALNRGLKLNALFEAAFQALMKS